MIQQQHQKQREQIQNQLSSFLKRTKQRQQQHHKLCQYTNRLLTRQDQFQQIVFIHDEIVKHQNKFRQYQVFELSHHQIDQKLAKNCDKVVCQKEHHVLGRRILSRILEVTYAAIQAFRQFRQYYSVNYVRFKEKCLKIVSQGSCKPSVAVRMGSKYLGYKMKVELERLTQTINCLELTNYQPFSHLKSTYYELLARKQTNFNIRRQVTITSEKDQSPRLLLHKNSFRQESSSTFLQRESKKDVKVRPKAKSTKQEEKQKQKQRKSDVKKVKKLANYLVQVMDLCKEQFLEDLAPENKDWQTKRLIGSLSSRNKVNQTHITTFLERQPMYNEVTSRPPPSAYKQELQKFRSLEKQLIYNDEDEVELIQNSFTSKNIKAIDSPKKTVTVKRRQSMRVVPLSGNIQKTGYKHQRATVNNIEQLDQKKKERPIFNSQKQIHQEHVVQIHMKGAIKLPKARFPEISGRAATVSKRTIQKRQEEQEQSSPVRTKLEIKSNSTYFEQIQKRIMKFCQHKKTLVK